LVFQKGWHSNLISVNDVVVGGDVTILCHHYPMRNCVFCELLHTLWHHLSYHCDLLFTLLVLAFSFKLSSF
jgi:hypothetical protein